jgi:NADH-quinone oxidoreductase subunit H
MMDLHINFWLLLVVKVAVIVGVVALPLALVVIFGELKISAHMQSRIGPYFAGGRFGWAQPLADGLKFMQKEDLVPEAADSGVYRLAPYVVLIGTIATFVIIPFGPDLVASDLDLGVFYVLAVSSLGTVGVLMAGWSSGNKYSLIGGLRAAAQLIAYELPLVLAVVAVVIQAGTLSLSGIVEAQAATELFGLNIHLPYVLIGQGLGFVIFTTAVLAELSRIPFDMPIAESELTMGYLTEYSGLRFTLFFLGEYAGMISFAAIGATLYLGGWWLPGFDVTSDAMNYIGPLVLIGKVMALAFLFIWIRWTWPRLREDQLQTLAWKWLIPASLVNIVATAFFKVVM